MIRAGTRIRIRSGYRGGRLNDPQFNSRMRGQGPYAEQIRSMFHLYCRKLGINREELELSAEHFRRPGEQMKLF